MILSNAGNVVDVVAVVNVVGVDSCGRFVFVGPSTDATPSTAHSATEMSSDIKKCRQ